MRPLDKPLAALAAAFLAVSLGCVGGESVPKYERSYYKTQEVPPPAFEQMDLPYHGGKVVRAGEGFMEVGYSSVSDGVTVEQLVEWWPAAVKAEGWVPRAEGPTPNGGFSGSYLTSDGSGASLSIHPTGTLWTVELIVNPK